MVSYEKEYVRTLAKAEAKAQERIGLAQVKAKERQAQREFGGAKVNIATIQRAPQTLLSKEQLMLQGLFGQKQQFWGNGEPVVISNTLTTGNGLIKTGSGDSTRRLFLP